MEHLSSDMEQMEQHQDQQVQWRRDKVQELCSNVYEEQKFTVQVLRDIVKSNMY
ncbi:MAG: hypothetical protein ACJ719_09335 [Nitrososphaeraceae archaeon]